MLYSFLLCGKHACNLLCGKQACNASIKPPRPPCPSCPVQRGGLNIDYPTILVPWGWADIFFPTDFEALGRVYQAAARQVWGEQEQVGVKVSTSHYRQVRGGGGGGRHIGG